jgi:hypothetical protein
MKDESSKNGRLVALALLAVLLFNYPLLTLFNRPMILSGIPILLIYMFLAWGALIALIAWITRTRVSPPTARRSKKSSDA